MGLRQGDEICRGRRVLKYDTGMKLVAGHYHLCLRWAFALPGARVAERYSARNSWWNKLPTGWFCASNACLWHVSLFRGNILCQVVVLLIKPLTGIRRNGLRSISCAAIYRGGAKHGFRDISLGALKNIPSAHAQVSCGPNIFESVLDVVMVRFQRLRMASLKMLP